MNYPRIAATDLLDTVADQLFRYCWSLLRNRETAQSALLDTLRTATARPAGADMPGSWLYALARAECARHRAVPHPYPRRPRLHRGPYGPPPAPPSQTASPSPSPSSS